MLAPVAHRALGVRQLTTQSTQYPEIGCIESILFCSVSSVVKYSSAGR